MRTAIDWRNKITSAIHTGLFRATQGRVGGRVGPGDVCLLTTTGRKSGAARTVALTYLRDGDRMVLVASNAGQDHHPAWYLNLVANPTVTVQRGGEVREMQARVANAEEKVELWPRIVSWWKRYDGYRAKTARDIPVVIVEPS